MAEEEKDKRYYWLRLKRDFFKRHDIQIIESQPNGKDYVLFYLKLLVESVDHLGNLRFSDTIPYNEHMLATITNTNIDIVRSAMKVFTELQMIDVLSDQTIYMNEIESLIGSESYWAEKKRLYRDKQEELGQCPQNVLSVSEVSPTCPSKSKSKNQSKSNSNNKKSSHFVPPSLEEVQAYCTERKNNVDPKKFFDYFNTPDAKGNTWIDSKGNKVKNWKQKIITWENHSGSGSTKQKPEQPKPNKFNQHPQRTYTDDFYKQIEDATRNKGL
jgi:predicted phage replisome organizer